VPGVPVQTFFDRISDIYNRRNYHGPGTRVGTGPRKPDRGLETDRPAAGKRTMLAC